MSLDQHLSGDLSRARDSVPPPVDRLIAWLPDNFGVLAEIGRPQTGRCIEASRIAVAVWKRCGVDCKAVACDVIAFNAEGFGLWQANVPASDWPDNAWSVACWCDDQTPHRSNTDGSMSRFNGHVIVVGGGWAVDLTARQFNRPAKGIVTPDCVLMHPEPDATEFAFRHNFTTVLYRLRPEIASWRLTPAWRQDLPRDLVDEMAKVASGGR